MKRLPDESVRSRRTVQVRTTFDDDVISRIETRAAARSTAGIAIPRAQLLRELLRLGLEAIERAAASPSARPEGP
jgi:hypothetical protein